MTAQNDPLRGLADIAMAAPVSMRPGTWAWAVLAAVLVLLALWLLWRWRLHREANRYRGEAIAALRSLEPGLAEAGGRAAALAQMAVILKRTALAAYRRGDVAPLSGTAWVAFLRGHVRTLPGDLAQLLDDLEYRPEAALEAITDGQARAALRAAETWIRTHHVSA